MKLILWLIALLLLFTAPASSELTVDDLEKIQAIVEKEVNDSKEGLKEDIAASEQRMREYISYEIGKVNIKMEEMDRRLTGEIKTLGERLDHIFLLVLALVAFVGVVVGVPQIIVARQRKDMRAPDEKIEMLQKQVEDLLQEMGTLKQERIVRP